jgi:hypothetical protein
LFFVCIRMRYKIPNLKEILKPLWSHNPGEAVNQKGWHKQNTLMQGSIPKDPDLLKKVGIKKGDKVLAIAAFYGDWAYALQKKGAKIDYSDVSKSVVNWVKKQKDRKFKKHIVSGYELIPKKEKEYDWTFTYEACGGSQGLPLAYLRSLLNNKGGILVLLFRDDEPQKMGGKLKRYPMIVNQLAKAYGTKAKVVRKKIKAHRKNKPIINHTYIIHAILTNNKARELAKKDIGFLWNNKNKRVFSKEDKDSLRRLSILAKALDPKFLREVYV